MLISFKVSNYKSLRDEQELSMLPSKRGGDFKALPVVAIYGANAAGKSNLIEALRLLGGYQSGDPTRPDLHRPFRLGAPSRLSQPTEYEFEVEVGGVRYVYSVAAAKTSVQREQLRSYPRGRPRALLDRYFRATVFGESVSNRKALKMLAEEVPDDGLVLQLAQTYRAEEFQPFRHWISEQLRALTRASRYGRFLNFARDPLITAFERFPVLTALARHADLGIANIEVNDDDGKIEYLKDFKALENANPGLLDQWITADGVDPIPKKLDFYHVGCAQPFDASDESEGTITFLWYMARILETLERGDTLVVDEFDTSLHPRLIPRIIELFKDKRTNPKNAQLIFTTHDVTLMGTSFGEPILSRDEVWFVEKGEDGASELYPLTAYKPRKEHNLERQYLGGSYGAVPEVYPESLVEVLVEHQERAA